MCELLGFSAKNSTDIRRQLQEFYSHCDSNPHGWGIMYDSGCEKEAVKANESQRLKEILETISPQKVLLGHIRYATVGKIRKENCHPFTGTDVTGRQWTLTHNGTIYTASRLVYTYSQRHGDTDSEAMFLHLINVMNDAQKEKPLDAKERFDIVDSFVCKLAYRNKLNLMIYDGELLYIHKNMEDTMQYRHLDSGIVFATNPLDGQVWHDVPTAQLTAYKEGELAFEGEKHGGIFESNLQYVTVTDAMNI